MARGRSYRRTISPWSARFERRLEPTAPRIEVIPDLVRRRACGGAVGIAAPLSERGKGVDETGGESARQMRTTR